MSENKSANDKTALLAVIDVMQEPDKTISKRLHAIISENAPDLEPRTWYGMPAYSKDGKVFCFFRSTQKFNERYMTLGFNDIANLDEGNIWPITFAVKDLNEADEAKIAEIIKKSIT